jgi:hypothetical protein
MSDGARTVSDGSRSAAAIACHSSPPARALITDFSDATAGTDPASGQPDIDFGTPPDLTGVTWTTALGSLSAPTLTLTATNGNQALQAAVNPGAATISGDNRVDFGLVFNVCVDASAFTAVAFTISAPGGLGTCLVNFGIQISEDQNAVAGVGTCDANACAPPMLGPVTVGLTPATVTVPFTQPIGGTPTHMVDPTAITGLQWDVSEPMGSPCVTTLVLDDISFQ